MTSNYNQVLQSRFSKFRGQFFKILMNRNCLIFLLLLTNYLWYLYTRNCEIQAEVLVSEILELKYANELCQNEKQEMREPSLEYEKKRRRIRSTLIYLWETFESKAEDLQNKFPNVTEDMKNLREILYQHKISIISDWQQMSEHDGYGDWRHKEIQWLRELVRKRFHHLMDPPDCQNAKFLRCHGELPCGWGCQISGYVNCFSVAFGLGRVLDFYKPDNFLYEKDEYNLFYKPVGNCHPSNDTINKESVDWPGTKSAKIIKAPDVVRRYEPRIEFNLLNLPADLLDPMLKVLEEPAAWWVSEIQNFLIKPKNETMRMFNGIRESLKFETPIVAVHVRRGNKRGEAGYQPLNAYMRIVEEYYDTLELTAGKQNHRRIFLMTDEPKVIAEIKSDYPQFEVFVNEKSSQVAGNYKSQGSSAKGIMTDIYLASQCDYFVGTLSSNVGRRIYEFLYQRFDNANEKVFSLDNKYFEFGEIRQRFRVLTDHTPIIKTELAATKNDTLEMWGYYLRVYDFHGIMPMTNLRTNQTGWIPSFKLERIYDVSQFPTFGIF